MDNNTECNFIDKTVTFDQFVNELATMIALRIHQVEISQTKVFPMYGRADVERWIKSGKLKPSRISPSKKRYKLTDLQKLFTHFWHLGLLGERAE